ncbi:MAG: FliA/WhiG family RNA polymerase sigma factor [Pseudomonadota bacterium]
MRNVQPQSLTYNRNPGEAGPEDLTKRHIPLVRKIAWHVHGRMSKSVELEDLIQIGMVALVEAAQNYEDRGYGFATYASMRIRGAMIDHIRKISNICRSAMALQKQVKAAEHKLSQELGRAPSEIEIAATLNMDIETFREQYDRAQNIAIDSMDEVYSDHNMWFADVEEKADDVLERKQMKEVLAQCIGKLKEREALVLQLYFVEEMNLDEIGLTMDISAGRVCQIKKSATDKLRQMLAGHYDG